MVRRRCSQHKKNLPQKDQKVSGIDRIGELPDSLLIHILSLLDDMKDAVKTDLLSKRWINLWTNVDSFVFRCDIKNPTNKKLKQFMLFVHKTLMQSSCPKIKKFCLIGSSFNKLASPFLHKLVNKWVDFVFEKNVEVVKFGLKELDYLISDCFFRNSSFVRLEIDSMGKSHQRYRTFTSLVSLEADYLMEYRYRKTFDLSWNKLKSLSLKGVFVLNDFMSEILLGCPVLETMILDAVRGLWKLDITNPSVRELKLLNFARIAHYMDLNITAPWVEQLEVSGCFDYIECRLVSVPSLKSASLTLNYSSIQDVMNLDAEDYYSNVVSLNMIKNLLQPVCNVEELVVGEEILQALSKSKLLNGDYPILNCKYAMLQSPICMHEVPCIVSLLESSPYLETLVIKMMPWQCHFSTYMPGDKIYTKYMEKVFSPLFNDIDYLKEQKGKFMRLKNVKIDCTEKLYSFDDEDQSSKNMCFELKVVAHIIRNAPVLEKLVILLPRSNCPDFVTRYIQLMSSEDEVGDKAAGWDLKKTKSTNEFSFCC